MEQGRDRRAMAESGADNEGWARGVVDDIALEIVSYLGTLQLVRDVKVRGKAPVGPQQITNWERTNFPHKLSQELRDFYYRINGFELTWNVGINDCVFPVGSIAINSIDKLKAAPTAHLTQTSKPGDIPIVASFVIEELGQGAKILVVYKQQSEAIQTTEVWLWDPVIKAHKIADTFAAYLRLAVMHLGIVRWQWIFSSHGLPPRSQNWMRLLCPQRLALDHHRQTTTQEPNDMEAARTHDDAQHTKVETPPQLGFRLDFSALPGDKDMRAAEKAAKPRPKSSRETTQSRMSRSRR